MGVVTLHGQTASIYHSLPPIRKWSLCLCYIRTFSVLNLRNSFASEKNEPQEHPISSFLLRNCWASKSHMNPSSKAKMNEVNSEKPWLDQSMIKEAISQKLSAYGKHAPMALILFSYCLSNSSLSVLLPLKESHWKVIVNPKLLQVTALQRQKSTPKKSWERSQIEQGLHPIDI